MTTSPDSRPLVSCIMPTCNRRAFAQQAIRYFQRQDYENRELIIIDDGADGIGDIAKADGRIRYIRLDKKATIGAKRNKACEQARGELIMHWDDDDWMAPQRIKYQVEALMRENAEVCGLRQMLFHNIITGKTWLYEYPANQKLWMAGGSLLYRRDFWSRSPFRDISVGEDTRFVWARELKRANILRDYSFYVAMIHSGNTAPKDRRGTYWVSWPGDLRTIMGEDLNYYQALPGSLPDRPVTSPASRLKLNLGCCDAPLSGYINVDIVAGQGVDKVADLKQPWPWAENCVDHIRAWDIIEHLPDKIFTMNELWRVLKPGGRAEIAVPTTDGPGAFQDPTHVSFWNRRSFLYYEAGNPYRERFARNYGIQAKFRIIQEKLIQTMDGPRLEILLEAVKP